MTESLLVENKNNVLIITMNRPESRNALTSEMLDSLLENLTLASNDDKLKAVVLTGAGSAFCSGGDIKSMADTGYDQFTIQEKSASLRRFMESSRLLHEMSIPTIAIIPGAAAGAGFSLALACDLRIASDNAKFTTAFVRVAFSGDFGGSYYLTKIVGTAKARELYYLGNVLKSNEALELGIINKMVLQENLLQESENLIKYFENAPPIALRYMKKNMNVAEKGDLKASLDLEALHHTICGNTEDHKNAAKAFLDKKDPVFIGR